MLASCLIATVAIAQGATSTTRITVSEVVVATGVEDHEPVGTATTFPAGTDLVCFIRANNRTGAEGTIAVSWESAEAPVGRARGGTSLTIPARPTFRTYARSVVDRPAGSYRCVVRGSDGRVLGSADFTVQ
jgi:hypothetical protein